MMGSSMARVLSDLAPHGRIRAAINLGNHVLAQRGAGPGDLRGVSVDLARELARRLGAPLDLIAFDAAGRVLDALQSNAWDVAFLAIDPVRELQVSFTPPYLVIEGTYIVRESSPLESVDDFDQPGIRIAVGRGAAYDLFLTRTLKHAELVRADTSSGALDHFAACHLDAAAGVRAALVAYSVDHCGFRVIDRAFTSISQSIGTPAGRDDGARYLAAFIEEMKQTGFVRAALTRSGQGDVMVAPRAAIDRNV
jgi:polar amino acid transport system substrate-binding protein